MLSRVIISTRIKVEITTKKKSRWHVKYASGIIGVLKCIRINNDKYMYIIYS